MNTLNYQYGFGNHFETECLPNALIKGCNSPQKVPYGLYAEQLSGTAFTTPRHVNLRSWLYRIRPSVMHEDFIPYPHDYVQGSPFCSDHTPPTQMRWDPIPYPNTVCHFIDGLKTMAGNGSIETHTGAAIHVYTANCSMENTYFYNADGELIIVPQSGALRFKTELGWLDIAPQEILIMPRGVKFQVELLDDQVSGYICENFGAPFRLPELGVIGANGLANSRDFQAPIAAYEDKEGEFILLAKFQGKLWQAATYHSPLDVVAWHGTYTPYKYNLNLFNTINSVSFDHVDPSIFTVLTSPTPHPGIANVDFVIFPQRWIVADNTFRPPYFHRNIMSEFMGLITGMYDAKGQDFVPGGSSLHNCMTAHGPDAKTYEKAIAADLKPEFYQDTLAFMFESRHVWRLTEYAYHAPFRQKNYLACWQNLRKNFTNFG